MTPHPLDVERFMRKINIAIHDLAVPERQISRKLLDITERGRGRRDAPCRGKRDPKVLQRLSGRHLSSRTGARLRIESMTLRSAVVSPELRPLPYSVDKDSGGYA